MAIAQVRLRQARSDLENGFSGGAVNAGYYVMLYCARAALSEFDENSKTHAGTWHLFRQRFVIDGDLEESLVRAAQRAQRLREAGDYDAREASADEAEAVLADAEKLFEAVRKEIDS